MATPPRERCGGRAQGYLKKDHPVPSDGVVNRQVCIQNPSNSCRREIQIRVVNCGLFYLYQLQRLRSDCNLNWRYCTNGKGKHLPSVIIIIITIMNIIMALKLLLMIKLNIGHQLVSSPPPPPPTFFFCFALFVSFFLVLRDFMSSSGIKTINSKNKWCFNKPLTAVPAKTGCTRF